MKEQRYQIQIDDVIVTVTKKRMKNMYLRIRKEDGSVQISAPHHMSRENIREFAGSHLAWIKAQQRRWFIERGSDVGTPVYGKAQIEERKRLLKDMVLLLIERWEPVMGVKVSGVTIRQMKTRWGSCNARTRHININLALLEKDEDCLEYVVVHEMTHILEASHSAVFWGYMDRFYPDWRRVRERLNRT